MLRYIVRIGSVRFYDVFSIILLSAAVNVLIWGLTLSLEKTINLMLFYKSFILAFILLSYSGWCFYWLHKEVGSALNKAAGLEYTAISTITDNNLKSTYIRYFILSISFFILGIFFVSYSARLLK